MLQLLHPLHDLVKKICCKLCTAIGDYGGAPIAWVAQSLVLKEMLAEAPPGPVYLI